jgi:hypothetical protein
MLPGHRQAIVSEGKNGALYCFANVCDGCLPGLALRNAAWKAWALSHPEAVPPG